MIDFVLEYMESKGICVESYAEQESIENGISLYLLENGIGADQSGDYYKQYVTRRLNLLNKDDLKTYFVEYPLMSDVLQIVMEYQSDGKLSDDRVCDLRQKMKALYDCGLGDKYVPAMEIRQILG